MAQLNISIQHGQAIELAQARFEAAILEAQRGSAPGSAAWSGRRTADPRRSPGQTIRSSSGTMSAMSMPRDRFRWPGRCSRERCAGT